MSFLNEVYSEMLLLKQVKAFHCIPCFIFFEIKKVKIKNKVITIDKKKKIVYTLLKI
jgi:ribosomal protein S26